MHLKRVHVRHYKSLDDVSVELDDRITVLVGPNAVGKSNFVDALRFLRDASADSLDHAVSSRGGITRIRQFSKSKPFKVHIRIDVESLHDSNHPTPGHYELLLKSLTAGNYEVEREQAEFDYEDLVNNEHGQPEEVLFEHKFTRNAKGEVSSPDAHEVPRALRPDQLALGQGSGLFGPALGWTISNFADQWKFSALYPNALKELHTPDKDTSLREDGTNWASVLRALRRSAKGRQSMERVYEMMRAFLPTFVDVSVATVGSYLVPKFRFSGQGADEYREFDPVQLSDGTLRVFGILLSLYQQPAPTLLVIEEPEQTVHPGVLEILADAFKESSVSTQIVVTTHSPHLIDHFKPEQVRVVSSHEGLTRISSIKKSQMKAVQQGLMSLGEFMQAEGLQPEAMPE